MQCCGGYSNESKKNMQNRDTLGVYCAVRVDNSTRAGTVYTSDICRVLAIMLLGGKKTVFAIAVYVALGIAGLPVFSGFRSGIGVLLGATGGYIVGFLITPFIMLPFEKEGKGSAHNLLSRGACHMLYIRYSLVRICLYVRQKGV